MAQKRFICISGVIIKMKGQEDIFKRHFDSYFRRCAAFARSFVFDKAEAESIASDALTVLWQKREADFHKPDILIPCRVRP